ncbi:MAG: DUF2953 domain-containing protein [Clostridium sp.]|nr:DUF2953 domain-containing protein [Clostridium sp.]
MKVFLLILFIIFLISLIPIPLTIKLFYDKNNYYIKIYKFTILKKNKKDENLAEEVKEEVKNSDTLKKAKIKEKKFKLKLFDDFSFPDYLELIKIISKNTFKPHIYINGYIDYSLNDAYYTAISFGIISTYAPLLYWIINIIFKTKKFNLPINPVFKDEFIFNTEIKSIITISMAQTIYMVFLIIKGILVIKECKIEGGYENE